jgi:hypothetical protein
LIEAVGHEAAARLAGNHNTKSRMTPVRVSPISLVQVESIGGRAVGRSLGPALKPVTLVG